VFFVTDISNIAFSLIAKGLHDILEEYGYNLVLYNVGTLNVEGKIMDFFNTRNVDGAILAINEEDNVVINKFLSALKIPLIILDRELQGVTADYIYTDYYNGTKTAVEHLISLGHRRIGISTGTDRIRPCRETLKGYRDALKLKDMYVDESLIKTGGFTTEFGKESATYFFEQMRKSNLTACIAGSYQILVGFLESIQKEDINFPEDISLIAFEDSDLTRLMNPGITVIRRPTYDTGKKVAYFLLDRMSNLKEKSEASCIIVPTELVVRASTRAITSN
jgi:LacI family transcriptional regulator